MPASASDSEGSGAAAVNWHRVRLLALLLLAGCATERVAISQECVATGTAVRLADVLGAGSVVLVDGAVLFSQASTGGVTARWFGADLEPTTDDFWLGTGDRIYASHWVRFDHRALAQAWVTTDTPLPPVRDTVAIFSLSPGSTEFVRTSIDLPIVVASHDPRAAELWTGWTPGGEGGARMTAATGHGRPVFALTAVPDSCSAGFLNSGRLMLFDGASFYVHQFGEDRCREGGGLQDFAHTSTLVSLRDGGLGIFFRLGTGGARLWYSRVGPELGVLDQPPFLVGGDGLAFPDGGGYQASAAALGNGTILFTSRNERAMSNLCSDLALVEPDGTNARGALWQLPCIPPEDSFRRMTFAPTVSAAIEVGPLEGGHAVLAYGERTNVAYADPRPLLTSEIAWTEGVYLTTIDELGRRSSEIVLVTPPEATATRGAGTPRTETTGPRADDFEVQIATEGNDVVVLWHDFRPDAPGYYARRYTCSGIGGD